MFPACLHRNYNLSGSHRNSFQWGPFSVDVGLDRVDEDERRDCIMVDTPTSYFLNTNQYRPTKRLRHRLLSELGWKVRRVRWEDWVSLERSEKKPFLEKLFLQDPLYELFDRPVEEMSTLRHSYSDFNMQWLAKRSRRTNTTLGV